METRAWFNPRQPQTLYIAQMLLYFRGGMGLLFAILTGFNIRLSGLLFEVCSLLAGYGIAHEMRWADKIGVTIASLTLLLSVAALVVNPGTLWSQLLGLLFDVALVALLLHPMSRDYQKYWPKRLRR